MTDVCVIGQGHIGLPTALTIAATGIIVTGVDINSDLVDSLNSGLNHLVEPGLGELLNTCINNGVYKAQLTAVPADIFVISVPTPLDSQNRPIVNFVVAAANSIASHIKPDSIVILESTVPPGTTLGVFSETLSASSNLTAGTDYHVAYCPERVAPGTVLKELIENDRVVGGTTPEAASKVADFYKQFVTGQIFETDSLTAEMVKLSENIYRDVNIGLANELAQSAETLGANVWDVIELANRHPRVNIHQPGPGVGGYCIPVAPWMINASLADTTSTIMASREINASQPQKTADLAVKILGDPTDKKVAIFGAAYKGGVGDARETPTTEIANALINNGISVSIHDPLTVDYTFELEESDSALHEADLLLVLTNHLQFESLEPNDAAGLMRSKNVLDARNVLDSQKWESAGFNVVKLGVGSNNR